MSAPSDKRQSGKSEEEWEESRENAEGSPKFNSRLVRDLVCKAGGERR